MDVKNYSANDFPIINVLLSENNAIVTREEYIEVPEGIHQFVVSNLSLKLTEASMHVAVLEVEEGAVILQNPMLRVIEAERVVSQDEKDAQETIDNLENQVRELNSKIKVLNQKRGLTKTLVNKTSDLFPIQYSNRNVQLDQLKQLIVYSEKNLAGIYSSELDIIRERRKIENEKDEAKKKLYQLKSHKKKESYELSFSLVTSRACRVKLQMRYWVPAIWTPSYDLKIEGTNAQILFWGIIENLSEENWNNVQLQLAYTSFGNVSMARPEPQQLRRGIEGLLDETFQQYGLGKEKRQTTEIFSPLAEKITVPADGETHAYLMAKFNSAAKLFYYWNAAETDYIVIGAEFKNGEFDLLPGDSNFFKEGKIIGRGKIHNLIESNQTVQLPLAVDSSIIATKRLIEQKRPKSKRILLKYRLHLVSQKSPTKIEVLDILPLSNQPRAKIRLVEAQPEPIQSQTGLLRWEVDLKNEWEAIYVIEIQGVEAALSE